MAGHVFVVQGDLTRIACDAWLLPTDQGFNITAFWSGAIGRAPGPLHDQPPWEPYERARLMGSRNDVRQTWLGQLGLHREAAAWYVDCVEQFVRVAGESLTAHRVDRPPLLAVNHVGTGSGGARETKGEVLVELFTRLLGLVEELEVDVVVVGFDASAHAAAQAARMRVLGGSGPDAVERAIRHWRFESPERTSSLVATAERLATYARDGRLSVFMGAGVSAGAGLPGWTELLTRLGAGLTHPVSPNQLAALSDPRDQAALLDRRFEAEGRNLLHELAPYLHNTGYALQHGLLSSLPVGEYITTNFDELFEAAARTGGRQLRVLPSDDERDSDSRRWLLKLHGTLGTPESIVLTRSAYMEAPRQRGALFGLVQAMLMTRHMLFVGYGLRDEDFHDLVHEVRYARSKGEVPEVLGTALTLLDDPIHAEIWAGDVDVVAMRSASPKWLAAREVERLLDLVGLLAADRTRFLLDEDYAGMLDGEETELRSCLAPLLEEAAKEHHGNGWADVTRLLRHFGWSGENRARRSPSLTASPLRAEQGEMRRRLEADDAPTTRRWIGRSLHELKDGEVMYTHWGNEHIGAVRDGRLLLADGRVFDNPTAAAKALNGDVSVNGWRVWMRDGRSIGEIVDRGLKRSGTGGLADPSGREEAGRSGERQ